jgi:hypothetical protein
LTKNPKELARVYKRSLINAIKDDNKILEKLKRNKEIKGSDISEKRKSKIYSDLKTTTVVLEIGIIIVDTLKIENRFKENAARAFNYLIKIFLQSYKKSNNKFLDCTKMVLCIDERNVGTKSKHTLKDYLNTEIVMVDSLFKDDFNVIYCDSKIQPLIQLADYISNTTLRHLNEVKEATDNIGILKSKIVNKKFFVFPL